MTSYSIARKGYMFVLTEYGFEQKTLRNTFCGKNGMNKVPVSWVQKGYVVETKVEE